MLLLAIKDNANQTARCDALAGKPQMLFDAHLVTKLKAVGDAVVQVSARNLSELRALILRFGGKDANVIVPRRAGLGQTGNSPTISAIAVPLTLPQFEMVISTGRASPVLLAEALSHRIPHIGQPAAQIYGASRQVWRRPEISRSRLFLQRSLWPRSPALLCS